MVQLFSIFGNTWKGSGTNFLTDGGGESRIVSHFRFPRVFLRDIFRCSVGKNGENKIKLRHNVMFLIRQYSWVTKTKLDRSSRAPKGKEWYSDTKKNAFHCRSQKASLAPLKETPLPFWINAALFVFFSWLCLLFPADIVIGVIYGIYFVFWSRRGHLGKINRTVYFLSMKTK